MGEGTIATRWQETLARELAPKSEEQITKRPLTFEWAYTIAELYRRQQLGLDDTLARHPRLFEYAQIMSNRIRMVDNISDKEIIDTRSPKKIETLFKIAKESYYAHSGIHGLEHRYERLERIGSIFAKYIYAGESGVSGFKRTPNNHDKRIFASILEELGSNSTFGYDNAYLDEAKAFNQELVSREDIPKYHPYRVHALFALYDIEWRQRIGPHLGNQYPPLVKDLKRAAIDIQIRFYRDLANYAGYVINQMGALRLDSNSVKTDLIFGRSAGVNGALSEIAVLGEIRDYLISEDLHTQVEARKAYLREDSSISIYDHDNNPTDITAPSMSFDLSLKRPGKIGPLSRMNIEVKKNEKRQSYLPDTYVLRIGDGSGPETYASKLLNYSEGKINQYQKNQKLYPRHTEAINHFSSAIQPKEVVEEFIFRTN